MKAPNQPLDILSGGLGILAALGNKASSGTNGEMQESGFKELISAILEEPAGEADKIETEAAGQDAQNENTVGTAEVTTESGHKTGEIMERILRSIFKNGQMPETASRELINTTEPNDTEQAKLVQETGKTGIEPPNAKRWEETRVDSSGIVSILKQALVPEADSSTVPVEAAFAAQSALGIQPSALSQSVEGTCGAIEGRSAVKQPTADQSGIEPSLSSFLSGWFEPKEAMKSSMESVHAPVVSSLESAREMLNTPASENPVELSGLRPGQSTDASNSPKELEALVREMEPVKTKTAEVRSETPANKPAESGQVNASANEPVRGISQHGVQIEARESGRDAGVQLAQTEQTVPPQGDAFKGSEADAKQPAEVRAVEKPANAQPAIPQGAVQISAPETEDISENPASVRETNHKLVDQIVRSAKVHILDGGSEMTVRFNPPHLGTVRMKVEAQAGTVTASLQTSNESARQALQSELPALKQALADNGIHLDSINVSIGGNSDQGWNLNSGWNWEQSGSHHQNSSRLTANANGPAAGQVDEYVRSKISGVIDYFA